MLCIERRWSERKRKKSQVEIGSELCCVAMDTPNNVHHEQTGRIENGKSRYKRSESFVLHLFEPSKIDYYFRILWNAFTIVTTLWCWRSEPFLWNADANAPTHTRTMCIARHTNRKQLQFNGFTSRCMASPLRLPPTPFVSMFIFAASNPWANNGHPNRIVPFSVFYAINVNAVNAHNLVQFSCVLPCASFRLALVSVIVSTYFVIYSTFARTIHNKNKFINTNNGLCTTHAYDRDSVENDLLDVLCAIVA